MIDQRKIQQKSRLGSILISRNYISQAQLSEALSYQQANNLRLGESLLALKFIDQKQLNRALRRQNWLRSITAGVALVLAPFSPAFAASQGTTGKSSSASSQISVTILPKTILNSDANLKFNAQDSSQISNPLCTSDLGTSIFRIKATGSGKNGAFELADSQQNSIDYQVAFQHRESGFESLQASRNSREFQSSSVACSASALSKLKVSLSDNNRVVGKFPLNAANDSYTGVLTVTITAE